MHKNLAANYLKLNQNEEALLHCDKGTLCFYYFLLVAEIYLARNNEFLNILALELSPNDPKTLYRRASALEALERYEEAYRDAQKALISSPKEANIFKPLLTRLYRIVEERKTKFSQTKEKALKMIQWAYEPTPDTSDEDIDTGLNNVLVLCRERAGIEALLELGLLDKIRKFLNMKQPTSKDMNRKITAVRTLTEMIQFSTDMVRFLVTRRVCNLYLYVHCCRE